MSDEPNVSGDVKHDLRVLVESYPAVAGAVGRNAIDYIESLESVRELVDTMEQTIQAGDKLRAEMQDHIDELMTENAGLKRELANRDLRLLGLTNQIIALNERINALLSRKL